MAQQNLTVLLVDTAIGCTIQLAKNSQIYIMSLVTLHYTFNREFCCVNLGLISILLQPRGKLKLFFNVMALLQRSMEGFHHYFGKSISIGLTLT